MAVSTGDALEVKQLTQAHKMPSKELNDLLRNAVMNSFDSSQIIGSLVRAGADVNAGLEDGNPILISAIGQPCNLKALLENGATADVRDHWHRSTLEVAEVGHQIESARLVENALSHP